MRPWTSKSLGLGLFGVLLIVSGTILYSSSSAIFHYILQKVGINGSLLVEPSILIYIHVSHLICIIVKTVTQFRSFFAIKYIDLNRLNKWSASWCFYDYHTLQQRDYTFLRRYCRDSLENCLFSSETNVKYSRNALFFLRENWSDSLAILGYLAIRLTDAILFLYRLYAWLSAQRLSVCRKLSS